MALRYDVLPYHDGWAIIVTPAHADAFATKSSAYEAAIQYARKLRCTGESIHVHVQHNGAEDESSLVPELALGARSIAVGAEIRAGAGPGRHTAEKPYDA